MNVYCSVLRFSPGKRDAQIHTHITLISVSGDCVRKIRVMIVKEIKENSRGEVWRSARGKNGEVSRAFGRAKEGMNQPLLLCPFLALLCNCSEFSGFLKSVTFTYIIGLFFLLKYLFALSWTV